MKTNDPRIKRCKDCGGALASEAAKATGPWYPGKFCSCPFDDEHP